ncbi:hypothetical protein [Sunxiuqinia dokdonensis]|uniref:Uncharacterized protein n=1 Tax=Sunxiuqinia dokdonensis TaxID=1409788 RepID=A0A0L8V2A4_9BACT|nr:hypothetical protein [Sunxiuqinia dokdonensis]KOH42534.1 hypothetical protein NC99_46220 [Sunxiuqinia dokdonensis]
MNSSKLKILICLLPFMLSASCTDKELETKSEQLTIYFQFEYVNHAWGYQHRGFIIDQAGKVYDYEQPENWTWPEDNKINRQNFESNLSQAEVRLSLLDESDIRTAEILALKARDGELTEQRYVMADAGAEIYAVYVAEKNSPTLTRYLLQQRGDLYQKNTSSASDQLTEWLIGIRGEEGYSGEHF